MLRGRLGLDTARIPHKDRHGLLWLSRGMLSARDGTLHFLAAGDDALAQGAYDVPFQGVSCVLIGPGTSVTHDAMRLLARHGTGLVAVGQDGVRHYASMPFGPDDSALARRQVRLWSDPDKRISVARRMYALRLGEVFPHDRIEALRGMEGARARRTYQLLAERHGVRWEGRKYDRDQPGETDPVNMALNHASSAVRAAAQVAVAVAGAIPQLGFIHEDSGISFPLDIADLYRDEIVLPCAFRAFRRWEVEHGDLERAVRYEVGGALRTARTVAAMVDRITELLDDDRGGDP